MNLPGCCWRLVPSASRFRLAAHLFLPSRSLLLSAPQNGPLSFLYPRGLCWVRRVPPHRTTPLTGLVPEKSGELQDSTLDAVEDDSEAHCSGLKATTAAGKSVGGPTDCVSTACTIGFAQATAALSDVLCVACADEKTHLGTEKVSSWQSADPSLPKVLHSSRMLNSNHAVVREYKAGFMQWFPYLDQFVVKDKVLSSAQIKEMLGPFLLEERKCRIKKVVANRTYTICVVIEGLLDLGNIAAVFRSADALGFQSVHVISNETEKRYKKNRKISMGSEKWLDAELYKDSKGCLEELQSRGYRIAVASVADDSVPISDMDWTIPTAVVFGNEFRGVSKDALEMSDLTCYIPMEGMVDSFNVSVAAGIIMHHAVNDRKARLGKHGDLSVDEQRILSAEFYMRHSSRSLSVIDRLLQIKQEERQTSLRSVLQGGLELDIELPEYLKVDVNKVCSELDAN